MSVSDKMAEKEAEDNSEVTKRKKVWPQHLAASLATLSAACAGAVDGWTAAGLPYLQEPHSFGNNSTEIPGITYDEASWIGSLSPLGSLFGAIPAGYISNALGRKCVLLLVSLPMLLGWLMIVFAERSIPLLYTARFIQGFTCGVVTVASPLYNEEIAEVSIRGALGVYLDLMFNVGILYVYIVGAALPYLWMSIASCAIPIVFAITFMWMPESPIYLLVKGKDRQAEKALRWLRRGAEERELEAELKQMQQFVRSEGAISQATETSCTTIFTPATVKAMYIIFGLMIFRQLCGMNAVLAYTVDIFIEAGGQMSPYVSTVIVGIVQLVATYIPYFLVDCAGRRILLIISDVGMAICLLAMVVHFYLLGQGVKLMIMNWVPLIAVNVYILTFSVGFGPLPWFMMPELLSNQAKGWVSSVAVCLNWALAFVVTKFFPVMNHNLGPAATYGTCFLICVLGTIFVAVFVPETKGKTREEIQLQLSGTGTAV